MKIIFATKNKGKLVEIKEIFKDTSVSIISMEEAGIDMDIVEDGSTFTENAVIKATAVMQASGMPAMADDSGLEIDFLDKQPGVMSARYMGEDTPYSIKNGRILQLLNDVPGEKRAARFVCAIATAFPEGVDILPAASKQKLFTTQATIEGLIAYEPKGGGGFGYDPIFYVPELGMTTAELSLEQKNKISHRGKALRQMKTMLFSD